MEEHMCNSAPLVCNPETPCISLRLLRLEQDSHPAMPSLDADDAQRVFDDLERRISALESDIKTAKFRSSHGVDL
jgi:hypothetical protein